MRILFLTQWFHPEPGAIRGLPLARALARRGHEIRVLTGFPNYPGGRLYDGYRLRPWMRERMEGIPVLRVPLFPSHDRSAWRRIVNYASFALSTAVIGTALAGKADVVYVYHPPPTVALAAMLWRAFRGIPFVYHIADLWPESVTESGMILGERLRRCVGGAISVWCDRVYRQAAVITVLSPGLKRLLRERGVEDRKVHIVYNWTDEEMFRPLPRDEALARELGLAGRFNVIYAGNLGTFQGLETVIRAALRLRNVPQIQIVFVGTGQAEPVLRDLAVRLGADNVRFLGRRQFWEMPAINALADVLLVSLKKLPFFRVIVPSKTQVSLASGRPVLMAVEGDSADIIRRAGAGLVCEPEDEVSIADGIRTLWERSPEERDEMGRRGMEFYRREMSLETGAAQMESLFREVVGRRRRW